MVSPAVAAGQAAIVKLPGRRTRDGRTPCISGSALAEAYEVQQSKISRWERYWLEGDWRRLLSERAPDVLTLELQDQIISYYRFPWWGAQKVHQYLNQQRIKVSHRQVRQAALMRGSEAPTITKKICD